MRFDFTNPEYRKSDKFNIGIQKKNSKPPQNPSIDTDEKSSLMNKLNSLFKKKTQNKDINNTFLNKTEEKISEEKKSSDNNMNILKKKFGSSKKKIKEKVSKESEKSNTIGTQELKTPQQDKAKESDNQSELLDLNSLINMPKETKDESETFTNSNELKPLDDATNEIIDIENNPAKQKLEELFKRLNESKKSYLENNKADELKPIESKKESLNTIEPIVKEKIEVKREAINLQKESEPKEKIEETQTAPINDEDEFLSKNTYSQTKKEDNSFDDDFLANFVNSTSTQNNIVNTPQTSPQKPLNTNKTYSKNSNNGLERYDQFRFTATAREYFGIWIVNIFLSIMTLGIYSAWAKVRTNKFFYANTYVGGSNFEYNADPKKILKGRLIVVGLYGLFIVFSKVLNLQIVSISLFVAFILVLPWLIRQALKFRLKSSSFRNIRFRYEGRTRDFYKLFTGAFFAIYGPIIFMVLLSIFGRKFLEPNILLIIAVVVSIAYVVSIFFVYPILYKKYKELIVNNSYFGRDGFKFSAKKRDIVKIFLKIFAISALAIGLFMGVSALLHSQFNINLATIRNDNLTTFAITAGISILYIAVLSFTKAVSDGYLSNFTRNHTTLGELKLEGKIKPLSLGFIAFTNMLVIILSFGLLYPWAKIRYLRYKMENTYCYCEDYDRFIESSAEDTSAYGEETADFFDIDIGV